MFFSFTQYVNLLGYEGLQICMIFQEFQNYKILVTTKYFWLYVCKVCNVGCNIIK
jgi:hypothetical protein